LPFYTVGQREGLGIAVGRPLYVVALEKQSNTLVVGEGRAHSVSGGGGLELDMRNARLSVEYVYEHVYYAGANKQGMDMPPSQDLQSVWQKSLVQDRNGIRVQAGYAF